MYPYSIVCEVCGKEVYLTEEEMEEHEGICCKCWHEWLMEKFHEENEYRRNKL